MSVVDPIEYYSKRVFVGVVSGPITKTVTVLESPARRAIVYLLAIHGPLTLKEISEKLKLSPSTIHDHLKKLKEADVIKEAEEHPKKFKVEIYYKLNVPYILFSELRRLEHFLKNFINEFSMFMEKARSSITDNIKDLNLRCLMYGDRSLHERVVLVILNQLSIFIFSKLVNEPLAYILINDLEESKSNGS